ncbi:hypothetical protein [Mesobacillus thioparans]|uniref:hypothetical protein n=1 Tax=Mesobacillus thioparans TaxID=370439 RepID=UPI0039F125F1
MTTINSELNKLKVFVKKVKSLEPLIQLHDAQFEIPCVIQKKAIYEKAIVHPIIHKNILGQILYEISQVHVDQFSGIFPFAIILHPNVVEDIDLPGLYIFDSEESRFLCKKVINEDQDVAQYLKGILRKKNIESYLAIGFSFECKSNITEEFLENVIREATILLKNGENLLDVHGEITSSIVSHLEEETFILMEDQEKNQYSLLFTQWINSIF